MIFMGIYFSLACNVSASGHSFSSEVVLMPLFPSQVWKILS